MAAPDRRVISFMGDGGFGFTAMELATAVRYGLNVTVVIHNDDAFSSIANYQRVVHGRTYECDLTNPNFVDLRQIVRSSSPDGSSAGRTRREPTIEVSSEPGPAFVEIAAPIKYPWDR